MYSSKNKIERKNMGKREFLEKLEEALIEKMDISEAMPHIIYYKEYIENEVAKGKLEKEVINNLQSPRLIAKSITSNYGRANKYSSKLNDETYDNVSSADDKGYYSNYSQDYGNAYDGNYGKNSYENYYNKEKSDKFSCSINGNKINGTLIKILLVLIAIIFIVLFVVISGVVLWLITTIALPLILIGLVVGLVRKIFFQRK